MRNDFFIAIDLLHLAKQSGIKIISNDGQLQLKFDQGKSVDRVLLDEIKANKQIIIEYLANKNWKFNKVDQNQLRVDVADRNLVPYIPVSFSQERLWFIDQLGGSVQYHLPTILRLKGELNIEALEKSLKQIVNRHEVLRTVILDHHGEPYQFILPDNGLKLSFIDGQQYRSDAQGLQKKVYELVNCPFDLSKDHLLRAALITLNQQEYMLVVTMHHIASDGWSVSIIVKEVVELYSAFEEGRPVQLAPLKIQYADFAIWQRNYLTGEVLDKKISYWKNKLTGVSPLQLPTDHTRPAVQSTNGASAKFSIDNDLTTGLQSLSKETGTTMFMTLLAAFKLLLHRYSGQQDICVGTPIAGRMQQESEELIGYFVNTLALRTNVDDEDSFVELLQKIKQTTLDAYAHQELPFEKVVEAVVKDRDLARSPLFQVMFVLQNTPDVPELRFGKVQLSRETSGRNTAMFELTFNIVQTTQGLQCLVEYNTDLFESSTIINLITHFKELLYSIVQNPQHAVGKMRLLGNAEEQQLQQFNNGSLLYPQDKTIIDLFQQQVLKTPEAVAILFDDEQLTYAELDKKSNQLAHYLRSRGVGEETLVPVFIERSIEMVIGLLGILKAGGAYVPIDPEYPEERIRYMLEDTAATIVLSSRASRLRMPLQDGVEIIELRGNAADAINQQPSDDLKIDLETSQLAYVIYTSGSTGKPKGVMIEHKNVFSFINWCQQEFSPDSFEMVYASTSICFDLSIFEIFYPLAIGKKIRILENGLHIGKYLVNDQAVLINTVPVVVDNLIREGYDLSNVSLVNMAGEPVPPQLLQQLDTSNIEVRNLYGPTEATTYSTVFRLEKGGPVLIGKPIANTTVHIIDQNNQRVPVGVYGEIAIGGAGIARGYLNRDDLTAEKFVKNLFSTIAGSKLYKTGDSGRWLADGNIEYQGRLDNQVKIRGYRVELGEIETVLCQCELVSNAVVLAKDDGEGIKNLVGYIVPTGLFEPAGMTLFLQDKLPGYMIPSVWVEMQVLPLTPNGKIDRKALPDPGVGGQQNKQYVPPATELEIKLVKIWEEILKVSPISREDNFFQLGGHSLLAMRLISQFRRELELEIPIKSLFLYPTIASMAGYLETQKKGLLLPAILVQQRPVHIPLSFSQERLWFIDQLEGSKQYHIPSILRLKGNLNKTALQYAFQQIINRHEILRTVIQKIDGQGYQLIKEQDGWQLNLVEGAHLIEDSDSLNKYIRQIIYEPFDLSKDFMIRGHLISLTDDVYILVITIHHIASDAWSMPIIIKEVVELYNAFEEKRPAVLAPLQVQYADFALWQKSYLTGDVVESKLQYWKDKLEGLEPLQLPTDYPRPVVQGSRGAVARFSVDKELGEQLHLLSTQHGTTMFMTVMAVFNVLLYRYTGQQDICIGTPIANRTQQELEDLVGYFLNTLALRNEVNSGETFAELLQQVKSTVLEAYQQQDVPYEKVVDAVVRTRDLSRNPIFQVLFVYQTMGEGKDLRLGNVQVKSETLPQSTSKFDISLFVTDMAGGMQGSIEYCTDLYNAQTIERMITHFKVLLKSAVKGSERKIASLQMLTKEEEKQVLKTFNDTAVPSAKGISIVNLFETQVRKTPADIAVVFDEKELTYRELNERANRLAHYLSAKGVTEETLVPICIDRSFEMIIGVIAILKAGGAYIPIDPEYPEDRIEFMLKNSGASIAVTNNNHLAKLQGKGVYVINIEELLSNGDEHSNDLQASFKPDRLAYVLYTSGSTGNPKGVRMQADALTNLLNWQDKQFKNRNRHVLQFASLNFDVSFQEIFSTLCFGSTLYLIQADRRIDMPQMLKDIKRQNITHLFIPFIVLKNLAEYILSLPDESSTLEEIIIAGEQLKVTGDVQQLVNKTRIRIINQYGPTEAHVVSSYVVDANASTLPPIGKPIDNTQLYILRDVEQLLPVGITGELFIGGVQVARGYLNLPELTAERFIPDPYSDAPGAKMYKTGDLARWLPDGNIEYLGRIDDQVKIRGFRIELGEIEAVLQKCALVRQAVVLAKEDSNGNKRLVGYVVPEGQFQKKAIIKYLEGKLPEFMVPALWVEQAELPITKNGKIDRKALPDPDASELLGNIYVAPSNEMEEKLARIWQEVLKVKRVGTRDNFFELGGHSMLAVKLIAQVEKVTGYRLPLGSLFEHSTVEKFSLLFTDEYKNKEIKALIPIKKGGDKIPLYIVCGAGGTAFAFKNFAEALDPRQPVYGLQQPSESDLKDLSEFPSNIEDMAAKYIAEIIEQNPTGPYALAGHCVGGYVAFEMAKQLQEIGKEVSFLSLFDTIIIKKAKRPKPNLGNLYLVPYAIKNKTAKVLLKIAFEMYLLRHHTREAIQYKISKLRKNIYMPSNEQNVLQSFDNISKAYLTAILKYKLKPYDGAMSVYYAKEHYYFKDKVKKIAYKKVLFNNETKLNWTRYSRDIKFLEVEGEHSTIFDPEYCKGFARLVQEDINNEVRIDKLS